MGLSGERTLLLRTVHLCSPYLILLFKLVQVKVLISNMLLLPNFETAHPELRKVAVPEIKHYVLLSNSDGIMYKVDRPDYLFAFSGVILLRIPPPPTRTALFVTRQK